MILRIKDKETGIERAFEVWESNPTAAMPFNATHRQCEGPDGEFSIGSFGNTIEDNIKYILKEYPNSRVMSADADEGGVKQ